MRTRLGSKLGGKNLFVTVGSTRFDKLIQSILTQQTGECLQQLGFNQVTIQAGKSDFNRTSIRLLEEYVSVIFYDYKESISEDIKNADIIVGHAGAGTCLEALREGKKLLVVINDDLMDNHQKELADQLHQDNYVLVTNLDRLTECLREMISGQVKLSQFPPRDESKFEEIFNDALRKAMM